MTLAPIAPHLTAKEPTTLILKEKKLSLTGDDAKILNAEGKELFKINAKMMTMSERRTLKDLEGNEIGQLRKKKTPGLHHAIYIGTMSDEKKCMVKEKGKLDFTKCDAEIYLGGNLIGYAAGNWRAKTFSIKFGETEAATIRRKISVGSIVMEKDTYCIDIQPGFDIAFIALIAQALDELYHED